MHSSPMPAAIVPRRHKPRAVATTPPVAQIVCFGEPMVEFNQAGPDRVLGAFTWGYGGDTSNCAIAAARQGARVAYVTAVGRDVFGDALVELWRREGVDHSHVLRDPDAPTGVYFVTHHDDGHAFTYYRAGSAASRFGTAQIPETLIAQAQIVHMSGISQAISDGACDAAFRAIDIAKANGVRVSYDTNFRAQLWPLARARAVIHGAIAQADIALPSLDDAVLLTGLREPDAIVDFYLGLGCDVVALKMGANGALVATGRARRRIAPYKANAVDATGAGDTFAGAFLAALIAKTPVFEAATTANVAAALSTCGYGAVAPIPGRTAVAAALSADRDTEKR